MKIFKNQTRTVQLCIPIKRPFFILFVIFASLTGQAQTFTIKGKIKGQDSGVLVLYYPGEDGKTIQDSAVIQKGLFEFTGRLTEPVMASFTNAKNNLMDDQNRGSFFIEPGTLSLEVIAGDFKNLKLTGSRTQDEMTALNLEKSSLDKELKPLAEAYQRANEAYTQAKSQGKAEAGTEALKEKAEAIYNHLGPINKRRSKIDLEFIKNHPDSYLSANLLLWNLSGMSLQNATKYYNAFTPAIKQSTRGKEVLNQINALKGGSPGSTAHIFSTKDMAGLPLSLKDFKGRKYVLLDFWASWCAPCRKGNPHLLLLYRKYKERGLEIIGVSDDDNNADTWKKAVEKDQIGVWKHVLRGLKTNTDGSYDTSTDISALYGVQTLPTQILVDKNGLIIGRYGGGGERHEMLDKKLEQIFNN